MAVKMLNVPSLPNIPWQEKPADYKLSSPVWRYSENPVMGRNPTPEIARIFNSAVVPWEDGYIAVLRGEQVNGVPYVYLGHSKDGIHWDVEREKVPFVDDNGNPKMPHYAYDPRLVKVDDTYYIICCTDFYGAAIGMADLHHHRLPIQRIHAQRHYQLAPSGRGAVADGQDLIAGVQPCLCGNRRGAAHHRGKVGAAYHQHRP